MLDFPLQPASIRNVGLTAQVPILRLVGESLLFSVVVSVVVRLVVHLWFAKLESPFSLELFVNVLINDFESSDFGDQVCDVEPAIGLHHQFDLAD